MEKQKFTFEIRKVDAWKDIDNCWFWNSSIKYGEYTTTADNKRAFLNALHKLTIYCKRGRCRVIDDGEIYILEDRKTGEPLFAAIPLY